ncbi:MAG TPA: penicillin-binding protein 2 [Candidatus Paceibacterota bacterium]|nr:penicillin-binding protein 2 [Candidatus Paceibacterota bacterium]HOK97376.1 penicillin-binding protein 2 [Candidatus Paceibacterota bacterium]HPP64859.1 penicillin-binding protein 2 [Candidatus Paceibacterota bacterium]
MRRSYKRKITLPNEEINPSGRVFFIYLGFIILFAVLAVRLFDLQILKHEEYRALAEANHSTKTTLLPQRGLIYTQDKDKEKIAVAINKKYWSLYAVPKEIEDPQKATDILAQYLPLKKEEILKRLSKAGDPYEPLVNRIEDEELMDIIKELAINGIYFKEERFRYWPFDSLLSQTIGFVSQGEDGKIKGRYGLEAYYEDVLSGQPGEFSGVRDALGRLISSLFTSNRAPVEGANLITTIDKNIQAKSEEALENLIKGRGAVKGSIIVMEAKTGRILALANWPTFNLNKFNEVKDYSVYKNYAVEEMYEPGSVIKPLTMAAGIDLKKVTPETTYDDKGYFEVSGYRINNYRNEVYGKNVTMTKVLERSINTGAIFVGQKVGMQNLREYFKKFGLDEKTGIDLPNEITGDLSNLEYPKANPSHLATACYGEGITVTPIGLIRAYSAFLNEGKMVNPYIVEAIEDSNGVYHSIDQPEQKQVISRETAQTLTTMLVSVIENGFGGNAKIKGYSLGGKTGTAQIPLFGKGGYSDDQIHTFVGFFPASDPRFLILVKMDKPIDPNSAASHTVTLAFKEVEQFLINYYNIPPDEKIE